MLLGTLAGIRGRVHDQFSHFCPFSHLCFQLTRLACYYIILYMYCFSRFRLTCCLSFHDTLFMLLLSIGDCLNLKNHVDWNTVF